MNGRQVLGLLILVATACASLLPGAAAAIVGVGGLFAWLTTRPGRPWLLLVLPVLVAAAVLSIARQGRGAAERRPIDERAEEVFSELLEGLDAAAGEAARRVAPLSRERGERRRLFEQLQDLAAGDEQRLGGLDSRTWLVFDPDGEQFAWAGRGLVHEMQGDRLPLSGRVHVASFTATSFLALESVGEGRRPWRVGVGVTLPNDRLPGESAPGSAMWGVVSADTEPGSDMTIVDVDGTRVALTVTSKPEAVRAEPSVLLAALSLALTALFFAARGDYRASGWWLLAALMSVVLAARALAISPWVAAPMVIGFLLVWWRSREPLALGDGVGVVFGAGLVLSIAVVAVSVFLQQLLGPVDLGSGFGGGAQRLALRLSLFVLSAALLWVLRGASRPDRGGRWSLWAAAALVAGGAVSGWTWFGAPALLAGAVCAAGWSLDGGWSRRVEGAVVGLCLAALLSALAWELAYRLALEQRLTETVAEDLGPPAPSELEALRAEAQTFFDGYPLEELTVARVEELQPTDLAFALWRRSPLALDRRLSSVVVGPPEEPLSTFDYGLTAAAGSGESRIDRSSRSGAGWGQVEVTGRATVTLGGGPWVPLDYRLVLRPGFRGAAPVAGSLAGDLLRREAAAAWLESDLPGEIRYGFYRADGRVVVPPWPGASDMRVAPVSDRVEMPRGWAKTFPTAVPGGWGVAFLPVPTPLRSVERIAAHAAVPLLLVAALMVPWVLVRLGGAGGWSAVRSAWRSYSRRLVILYTVLLMVPVLLVNVLVLRVFDQRLESERRAAGYSALESAQRVLTDYVTSLAPGFGIDTAVGDDVLLWLSQVVHHEVNLYWQGRLSASSKRELYSSGLLPAGIPGDVFSRVALGGAGVASRTTRAGETLYQEFYGPLTLSEEPGDEPALLISLPLLAQEVATAEEMATIRRRILLSALALALLLTLLGRRLGRSLTRPVLEIVEATRSIAAGAPSIHVETTDSELVTLVEAVDNMAGRISAGRLALLEEKNLVDQMIDNVNSGVVSVDSEGRVLLLNRTANRLLGVEAGGGLVDALAAVESLAPVAAFVRSGSGRPRQSTVSVVNDDGEASEWSLVWVPLPGSEPAALFVIEDVTEVVRAQRLEAWAEMARMIAHEVKNPLTPIRLSTEHLREVSRSRPSELDSVLEQCTSNILRQVDELQQIVSEFSVYSRIPEIDRRPGDLSELVEEVVAAYRHGALEVDLETGEGSWLTSFDSKLLRRAVRNLLENAVRAVGESGTITVSLSAGDDGFRVRVVDSGPGVEPHHLQHLFEPYFSTEASGTGLGLPITRRIVEEHGGQVTARNLDPRGLEVTIFLPRLLPA